MHPEVMPPRPVMPFMLKLSIFGLAVVAACSVLMMIDMRCELGGLRQLNYENAMIISECINITNAASDAASSATSKHEGTSGTFNPGIQKYTGVNAASINGSGVLSINSSKTSNFSTQISNSLLTWDGNRLILTFAER